MSTMSVKYVCTGSCGGSVTEEQFAQGKTKCSATGCDKHGEPLARQECDDATGTCSMPQSAKASNEKDGAHGCCGGEGCNCSHS